MAQKIQTISFPCMGGLVLNQDDVLLSEQLPGAAIEMINYEPSPKGYRRINGFTKFSSEAVTGTGKVLGVGVYKGGVIAARESSSTAGSKNICYSSGGAWTSLGAARAGVQATKFHVYTNVTNYVICTDGTGYPLRFDGVTTTEISGAPLGTERACFHRYHMWYSKGQLLTFSVPNDETNCSAIDGGGTVNVGDDIVGMASFRGDLIIFCKGRIYKVVGTSVFNFELVLVTSKMGCLNGDTIQEIGGDLMFLSADGIRPLAASERIGDFELEAISRNVSPFIEDLISSYSGEFMSSVIIREKTQYRLICGSDSYEDTETFGLIGSMQSRSGNLQWEWGKLQGIKASCAADGISGNQEIIVHGGYDGYVYQQEVGVLFDDRRPSETLTLPNNVFGDPFVRKGVYSLKIFVDFEGYSDIVVNTTLDYGAFNVPQPPAAPIQVTSSELVQFGSDDATFGNCKFGRRSNNQVRVNLTGSGTAISFSFTSASYSNPYTIRAISVEMLPAGRY
jgi:hypothetical protein